MTDYRTRICAAINPDLPSPQILYHAAGQTGDSHLNPTTPSTAIGKKNKPLTLAAVLVAIIARDEPHVLLTQRAAHLEQHSGQVAFPGGKVEAQDQTPIATALREAHEEVGLEADYVDVAGVLDTYETGTGFRILPVVGFVREGFQLAADAGEVAHIFEVPLRLALDAANYKRHNAMWGGKLRHYHAMQYQGFKIWGATAGMLLNLGSRL